MRPTAHTKSDGPEASWASLVRTHRERLSLTQEQLADRLAISRKTVSRWENGSSRPDTIDLARKAIRVLVLDRESGLHAAGYGEEAAPEPDPYAWVREMGLDPNGRVVRHILSLDISDGVRMAALRREREWQLRDEERRLQDVDLLIDIQRNQAAG